jgi:hypothetical protein
LNNTPTLISPGCAEQTAPTDSGLAAIITPTLPQQFRVIHTLDGVHAPLQSQVEESRKI